MTLEERNKIEQDIFTYGLLQFRKYDEHLISNLVENKITFGSPRNFNDPFDCNLPINLENSISEYIDFIRYYPGSRFKSDEWIRKTGTRLYANREKFKTDFENILFSFRRFSCFNLAKKEQHLSNSLFWANYTNKHNGVCMKFSGELLKYYYNNHKGTIQLVPVEYWDQDIPYFNFIKNRVTGEAESSAQYFFGTKSAEWSYEEEIRFIYDSNGEEIGPFVNFGFDPKCLAEVYIGCKIKEEEQKVILHCLLNKKYDHIDIYKLKMDNRQFKLNAILIRQGKQL